MLDTVELCLTVTKANYEALYTAIDCTITEKNRMSSLSHKGKMLHCCKNQRWSYHTAAFYELGVLDLKLKKNNVNDYWKYWVVVKYKPAIALYSDDYALTQNCDYERAVIKFKEFIDLINKNIKEDQYALKDLSFWVVRRIDFAVQFKTKFYREYLTLFKKNYSNLAEDKHDSSFYISTKTANVNFYDKTIHLGKKDKEHVIRLEVQLKTKFLNNVYAEGLIEDKTLAALWDGRLAKIILLKKIVKHIGLGDYMCFEQGLEKLKKSYTPKKVEKIMRVLQLSVHNRVLIGNIPSIMEVKSFGEIKAKYVKDKLFSALEKANVNPVVIPASWGIEKLQNPISLIPEFKNNFEWMP